MKKKTEPVLHLPCSLLNLTTDSYSDAFMLTDATCCN